MDEKKQVLLEEWKDVRESVRYFGNKRFAQLTVFIAATGFLIDTFFKQPEFIYRIFFCIVGATLGILFLIMEVSSVNYWHKFAERGREIELSVGDLELMTRHRPGEGMFSSTRATYVVYGGLILFWVLALLSNIYSATLNPSSIIINTLNQAPLFAKDKKIDWTLSTLSWDEVTGTYKFLIRAKAGPQAMRITVDGKTGRIINIINQQLPSLER